MQQIVWFCLGLHCLAVFSFAQPDDFEGTVAEEKWTVLHLQNRRLQGTKPLPKDAKVQSITDLHFTGPKPGHPYVLGTFSVDGEWGLVDGYLQTVNGKNSALQLCWADQFELEGIIEQVQHGGWYLLMGWEMDRGFTLSNVNFKTSGSPWFLASMRGGKSIDDSTIEFDHFNWKGEQPFKLVVKENRLSLTVGKSVVVESDLEGYQPGRLIIGVYDTNYGPKPLRIKSLRVRSLSSASLGEPTPNDP